MGIALIVVAWLLECGVRALFVKDISISGELPAGLEIHAQRKPDFLWMGNAWWVKYSSKGAFHLDLGDGVEVLMPSGDHAIFSNHDNSNAREYGIKYRGDYPVELKIDK